MFEVPLKAKASIEKRLSELKKGKENIIELMIEELKNTLKGMSRHIIAIEGREKSVDSIYSKIKSKNCNIDEIDDIFGVRVILKEDQFCYEAAELIRGKYQKVMVKDFVKNPKSNGYQSLHAIVSDICGKKVEVQIRDKDMHKVAETGSAAHELYKKQKWQIQKH